MYESDLTTIRRQIKEHQKILKALSIVLAKAVAQGSPKVFMINRFIRGYLKRVTALREQEHRVMESLKVQQEDRNKAEEIELKHLVTQVTNLVNEEYNKAFSMEVKN